MDAYAALESICAARHSAREFLDKPVPRELVEKVLSIARTSPYAGGSKKWEVLVVHEKDRIEEAVRLVRTRVVDLHAAIRPAFQQGFLEYARYFSAFENAPVLLLPVFNDKRTMSLMFHDPPESILRLESENFVKSISCVTMLILLGAQSLGLASCFMTGALIAEEELGRLVNIKPGHRIGAVIPLGYAADFQQSGK
jgi:nitroreductase